MNFIKIARISLFAIVMMVLVSACEDDAVNPSHLGTTDGETFFSVANQADSQNRTDDDDSEFACITFVYPINIQMPDGSTTTVNSDAEFEQVIEDWFNNNPNATTDPTLVFPIQVTKSDGTTVTVNDDETLCDLFFECFDDWDGDWDDDRDDWGDDWGDEKDCFTINYPITLVMPDGATVTANSDEELEDAVENYYTNNPNDTGCITLNYPITVTLEDSTTQTVNSDEELDDLFEDCFGGFYEECFEVVFPITIQNPDGSTAQVNNEEELFQLFDDYYTNNPDATTEPTVAFPINVVKDGATIAVNNEEELEDMFEDCFDGVGRVGRGVERNQLFTGAPRQVVNRMGLRHH